MSLGSQALSASGPGPSRPLRARRTAPERAPSERHRSAITTRPQPCRASNTCAHKGGGKLRHARGGDGEPPSCLGNGFWPGARWLRTCRWPSPTRAKEYRLVRSRTKTLVPPSVGPSHCPSRGGCGDEGSVAARPCTGRARHGGAHGRAQVRTRANAYRLKR